MPRASWRSAIEGLSGRITVRFSLVGPLAVLVIAMQVTVFWGYWSGSKTPPWDFYGGYGSNAFAWWTDGSFFHPQEWMPYTFSGFPSSLDWQNSSWYLPVGIASLFRPYDLQCAAAVSALHVALGGVGIAVLARLWRLPNASALFAAAAWSFASGFYANAEHVDIVRGYGWAPWILALLSPGWRWRRPWAVPVGALIVWQCVVGVYPGILVAAVYCGLGWMAAGWIHERRIDRVQVSGIVAAGLGGLLLAAPKLLPAALNHSQLPSHSANTSVLTWRLFGTAFFNYASPSLPNDISMRSFFLPITVFVLVLFLRSVVPLARAALAALGIAVVLGLPWWPWNGVVSSLPGLGLSRFRMSDFKVFLLLALVLLAACALPELVNPPQVNRPSPRSAALRVSALTVIAAALAFSGPYSGAARVVPFLIVLVLGGFLIARSFGRVVPSRRGVAVGAILLTLASGLQWAFTETLPWRVDRAVAEKATYGATVDSLIKERSTRTGAQRPGRQAAPPAAGANVLQSQSFNRGAYSATSYVGGYVNLKGSPTADHLLAGLTDPVWGQPLNSFLAAPGTALATAPGAHVTPTDLTACSATAQCGARATVIPAGYTPGHLSYRVSANEEATLLLNEPDYAGWQGSICAADGCRARSVVSGDFDLVQVTVPAGTWTLHLNYGAPGREAAWVLFWLGLLFSVGVAAVAGRPRQPSVTSAPMSMTEKGRPDESRRDPGGRRQMAGQAARSQSGEPAD
ncbi:MAG: hypothetical protein JWN95_1503 [Frankiales bacterium]|nr:hypothetical protein [Frankiales bacterium]